MLNLPENPVFEPRNNLGGRLFADTWSEVKENDPSYKINTIYEIRLKNIVWGTAQLVSLRQLNHTHIRDPLSYLVTGQPAYYLAALLDKDSEIKGKDLVHLIFKWEIRNYENQQFQLLDWWYNTCEYGQKA